MASSSSLSLSLASVSSPSVPSASSLLSSAPSASSASSSSAAASAAFAAAAPPPALEGTLRFLFDAYDADADGWLRQSEFNAFLWDLRA